MTIRFCGSCGEERSSLAYRYCSSCGRQFAEAADSNADSQPKRPRQKLGQILGSVLALLLVMVLLSRLKLHFKSNPTSTTDDDTSWLSTSNLTCRTTTFPSGNSPSGFLITGIGINSSDTTFTFVSVQFELYSPDRKELIKSDLGQVIDSSIEQKHRFRIAADLGTYNEGDVDDKYRAIALPARLSITVDWTDEKSGRLEASWQSQFLECPPLATP